MIKAFFDGSCWPNPGGDASFGCYITDGDEVLLEQGCYLASGETMSNNVAEYAGLLFCLRFLKDRSTEPIEVYGDSRLVVKQMKGQWKIKKGLYAERARQAKYIAASFTDISFEWIPRDDNERCDALAASASLDSSLEPNSDESDAQGLFDETDDFLRTLGAKEFIGAMQGSKNDDKSN